MPQLSEIRDFVRQQTLIEIDDWANTKVDAVVNEGYRDIVSKFLWPFMAADAALTTVLDQQAYAFTAVASNISRIEAIIDNDKRRRLVEVAAADAWEMYGGDMPSSSDATHFFLWGNNIHLMPVPDSAVVDAYQVYYYKTPTLLSNDTDTPEWDAQFHMALAFYAIAKVWEREEDFDKAEYWQGRFNARVELMASFYLNRASDQPSIVGGGDGFRYQGDALNLPVLNGA